jgi:hypothetical protein
VTQCTPENTFGESILRPNVMYQLSMIYPVSVAIDETKISHSLGNHLYPSYLLLFLHNSIFTTSSSRIALPIPLTTPSTSTSVEKQGDGFEKIDLS